MINARERIDDFDDDEAAFVVSGANKKKVLLIVLPLLVLIGLIVSFYAVFTNRLKSEASHYRIVETPAASDGSAEPTRLIFYDLPEIDAPLSSGGAESFSVKIKLSLETDAVDDNRIATLDSISPRINDAVIGRLVELRTEEVQTTRGLYWLREELLYRINLITAPIKITNLNFKTFEIQKKQ